MTGRRLTSSVMSLARRIASIRTKRNFRRLQTNLDGVMGVRKRDDASSPTTRISTAVFRRAEGRTVDWPAAPPREWRRRHPEDYLD